jgi:hypothetical protein
MTVLTKVAGLILELDTNTLPHSCRSANPALRLAVGETRLDDFDNVAKLATDHAEEKDDSLFVDGRMLQTSKVDEVSVEIGKSCRDKWVLQFGWFPLIRPILLPVLGILVHVSHCGSAGQKAGSSVFSYPSKKLRILVGIEDLAGSPDSVDPAAEATLTCGGGDARVLLEKDASQLGIGQTEDSDNLIQEVLVRIDRGIGRGEDARDETGYHHKVIVRSE